MANSVLTQTRFKPVVVVNNSAIAVWHEGETPHEVKVELSLERLEFGAQAIMLSGYRWQDNRAKAKVVSGTGENKRLVGYIPEGGDIDLAVLNLEDHYMAHSAIADFLKSITVEGKPVDPAPPSYRHRELAIRRAVLTLAVRHLLAIVWQQGRVE